VIWGVKASIEERLALLLAIKEPGKYVDFDHLYSKVARDVEVAEQRRVSVEDVQRVLDQMVKKGVVLKSDEGYTKTPELDEIVKRAAEREGSLLNTSYLRVWVAKDYYPKVAEHMLPFLVNRAVSAVKVFSGKKDPLNEVEAIFVRYAKYKPKPQFLTVGSKERLIELVYDHCVDFIPYIHPLNSNEPDFFVLDLDAGRKIIEAEDGFQLLKEVTYRLAEMLIESGVGVMVKFSGSRGFQIWAKLDNSTLRSRGDLFKVYREIAIKMQAKLEDRLRSDRDLVERFKHIVDLQGGFTTSQVAHKEERAGQILVDWSLLKPMGDVRAPLSMHYKTGLISTPVPLDRLLTFRVEDARPSSVLQRLEEYSKVMRLPISDPTNLVA
jgi:DNA primase